MKPLWFFPEIKFNPVNCSNKEYYEKVSLGYARMSKLKVVICGCIRNIEEVFLYSKARIEKLGSFFKDYRVILYESDSTDQSKQLLQKWSTENNKLNLEMEDLGYENIRGENLDRVKRMAQHRNHYLQRVYDDYLDYDYMIVVDPDLHGGYSYDGIAHSFFYEDFDMIGANGLQYVNRHPVFFDTFPLIGLNNERYKFYNFLDSNGHLIPELQRGQPLIPVRSCFGGVGIYKITSLKGFYAGWGSPVLPQSEHISLNIQMQKGGFTKHFINPSLLTIRHFSDSNFKGLGLQTTLDFIYADLPTVL